VVEGLGTTIDLVLTDGISKEGDTIVRTWLSCMCRAHSSSWHALPAGGEADTGIADVGRVDGRGTGPDDSFDDERGRWLRG